MRLRVGLVALLCASLTAASGACASLRVASARNAHSLTSEDRLAILRRSQVWQRTDIPNMDVAAGPSGPGAFAPGATVPCSYVARKLKGHSPKFTCRIAQGDDVKVKYGETNGEVYAETAGTRLLWLLGFGADRMYPVRVVCRGCPPRLSDTRAARADEVVFEHAVIERKAAGAEVVTHPDEGWGWRELDQVQESAGGAPQAHRDALKLLAVLLQHGDNKPEQQRLVCVDKGYEKRMKQAAASDDADAADGADEGAPAGVLCLHPFMLINDIGLSFGRVDFLNRNVPESVNFERWSTTPIWKTGEPCVGNLPRAMSGSLHDPVISEAGRSFLAGLLAEVRDQQLESLFGVARFDERVQPHGSSGPARVPLDAWVNAFKHKRDEIAHQHCS